MNAIDIDTLKAEPGFELIKAFKDNRVYLIEETLVSRPTPRLLTGIEQLHRLFYPLFMARAVLQALIEEHEQASKGARTP